MLELKNKILKEAFYQTIPVLIGYVFMGMAFGILLRSKGYSCWWALLMSTTIYAGSMQFAAVDFLSTSFSLITISIMTFLINARHVFYGLSMLKKFEGMGRKKAYMIFSLTDETFSLLCSVKVPEGEDKNKFYFIIAMFNHSYWVIGSFLGALLGSMININVKGIDFVMTALFIVIFVEQWLECKNHIPAIFGLFISLVFLMLIGPNAFIFPALVTIFLALVVFRKKIEEVEVLGND